LGGYRYLKGRKSILGGYIYPENETVHFRWIKLPEKDKVVSRRIQVLIQKCYWEDICTTL
jgi:hypothetical protein